VLYYILLVLLLTAISLIGLLLMVKKFYWGPSGRPPQYRPHGGKLRPDDHDAPSTTKRSDIN
jgi:hypothetical protein